jgi:hypothetical protein
MSEAKERVFKDVIESVATKNTRWIANTETGDVILRVGSNEIASVYSLSDLENTDEFTEITNESPVSTNHELTTLREFLTDFRTAFALTNRQEQQMALQ